MVPLAAAGFVVLLPPPEALLALPLAPALAFGSAVVLVGAGVVDGLDIWVPVELVSALVPEVVVASVAFAVAVAEVDEVVKLDGDTVVNNSRRALPYGKMTTYVKNSVQKTSATDIRSLSF